MKKKQESAYLIGLDVLRFLLAISILIVHFPHFLLPFGTGNHTAATALPFQFLLSLIYKYGGFAVEIFWMVSGIIFYHFYLQAISDKKISIARFLFLRFSRLYPLHFITLIAVAFLQLSYQKTFHTTFVYSNHDALHFVLNVFMINFWNAKFGLSFNGPFWSVSAELFVYIVFFFFAVIQSSNRKANLYILVIFFFACYSLGILSPFYECLLYFFAGCLLIQHMHRITMPIFAILISSIAILLSVKYATPLLPVNEYVIRIFDCFTKLLIASAMVVLFAGVFSKQGTKVTAFLRQLGNMTYAIYMIHFPIQLVLIQLFFNKGVLFFNNTYFFLGYVTLTLLMGFSLYHFFEMPVQNFLRKKYNTRFS